MQQQELHVTVRRRCSVAVALVDTEANLDMTTRNSKQLTETARLVPKHIQWRPTKAYTFEL